MELGLVGEGFGVGIGLVVRRGGGKEVDWRSLGGSGGVGVRFGSWTEAAGRWPEREKKTLSWPGGWLGGRVGGGGGEW